MATHCLPSGPLDASAIPVPPTNAVVTRFDTPVSGPYRGVVVMLHGLNQSELSPPLPAPADSFAGDFVLGLWGTFTTHLLADGWVVAQAWLPADNYRGTASAGMAADVNGDTGHGTRLAATWVKWWDHFADFIAKRYTSAWPLVLFGASYGGLAALTIARDSPARALATCVLCPATIPANIPSYGATMSNSSGLVLATNALSAYTKPSFVAYGTSDPLVGWGLNGQGTCVTSPVQSNTDLIIVNAVAAGRPCTRYANHTLGHTFDSTDEAAFMAYFTGTIDPLAPKTL